LQIRDRLVLVIVLVLVLVIVLVFVFFFVVVLVFSRFFRSRFLPARGHGSSSTLAALTRSHAFPSSS